MLHALQTWRCRDKPATKSYELAASPTRAVEQSSFHCNSFQAYADTSGSLITGLFEDFLQISTVKTKQYKQNNIEIILAWQYEKMCKRAQQI